MLQEHFKESIQITRSLCHSAEHPEPGKLGVPARSCAATYPEGPSQDIVSALRDN